MKTSKEIAVIKYMNLRVRGFGTSLSGRDIEILNELPEEEWKDMQRAIRDLGGLTQEGEKELKR